MRQSLVFGIAAALVSFPTALARSSWAAGQTHRVEMKGIAFAPAQIKVRVGDTVEWRNNDIVAHTATAKEAGFAFDVNLSPGSIGRVGMNQPGTFGYVCRFHPNMKGEIVVEP